MVNHTSEVINTMDILLTCIKDAEISFRNFVMLDDTSALESYEYQIECINSTMGSLYQLIVSDPFQKKYIDTLYAKVNLKQVMFRTLLDEHRVANTFKDGFIHDQLLQGSRLTEEIRKLGFRMQTHENEKLAKTNEFKTISKTLKIVHFSTFIIALLLVIYSMIVFNNVSKSKLHYREQLEEGIEKLKIANNDLINLRSSEKFAASGRIARAIAHEVRNPLTSISLAAEQMAEVVKSADEKTLLQIITRNAYRINDLVSELLNSTKFSQLDLSRQSLNTIVENSMNMARKIINLNSIQAIKNITTKQ